MAVLTALDIKRIIRNDHNSTPVDDFRIIDSWAEYTEKKDCSENERPLDYLCYEIEVIDPQTGETQRLYKAIKMLRVIRLPKDAKESTSFMDMHEQVLSAVYENRYNLVTVVANIIEPVPLGLLFCYGVQGVAHDIEKARQKANDDYIGLCAALQGTYRVLHFRAVVAQESEWLREKMYSMDYLTMVRGIPKANKAGENAGNKGIGSKNINPDSHGTMEEIITGMVDYEYVIQVLSTPVYPETLKGWQTRTQIDMTQWYGQMQGTKSISANLSMPMMYMANASTAQGWSHAYTDADSVSYSTGESFTQGYGESIGQSLSQTFGQSFGRSEGVSVTDTVSQSYSVSSGQTFGQSFGVSTGTSESTGLSHTVGQNQGVSQSISESVSQSHTVGNSQSISAGTSHSTGTSWSQGESSSSSSGTSENSSSGWSEGTGTSDGYGNSTGSSTGVNGGIFGFGGNGSVNEGSSTNHGTSTNTGESGSSGSGSSQSNGTGTSSSYGGSESFGTSTSWSQGFSESFGTSHSTGITNGVSFGESVSDGISSTTGTSTGQTASNSMSESVSVSEGVSVGKSVGHSQTVSATESVSNGTSQSASTTQNVSSGKSTSEGTSSSTGQSLGTSGTVSSGTSGSMGLGPSIGYNKSYQWLDQQVKDILELLEFQNERIKYALRGSGAFYTYVYIATETHDALHAAQALAKSTWQNEYAMVSPIQVLDLSEEEQRHLLYHFSAFSSDVTRESVAGAEDYKYCTVLLPSEYTAYTHLPRVSEGGIFAEVNDVPKFAVPSMLKGEIFMGKILSAERYSMNNGYLTPYDYRVSEGELMHGFFTGASRSGKTVAAMRFIAELTKVRRKKTGKRLRIVCMDPKQDWRGLARFVEPERFRFYSMGNPNFHPLHFNPCKIPKGVLPQVWVDVMIEVYCRSYGLLERGKQLLGETFYSLYEEAGVFAVCGKPGWEDIVPELSANVTFAAAYERMNKYKTDMDNGTSKKGRSGNDTKDAYSRLLERLSAFGREFSIERRLFGESDGLGIDDLIGADDVTVMESKGLEATFQSFIFGVITAGFFRYAVGQERGYLAPDQYETVLVIEEANEVLTGSDTAGTGNSNMGLSGQSEFEKMLDQSAGYGLFVFAITQKIADMPKSIIANAGLVFAGKVKTEDDVNVIVRTIARDPKFDDRDIAKWFPRSPTGWFVCQSSRTFSFMDTEPILVKIAMLNISTPSNSEIDEILAERDIKLAIAEKIRA